ncbi:hypothetical protein QQZ08_011704 [Neonectria magnoliae]|uniref:Uncharacterized protein n=1 Tax=Neonectria magnoliae TaxID=2732573 RepID=A0ABR1H803_9HYPO
MGEEVQAAGKAITVGVDPVLGSDPHAFRYERQPAGTKPRYYNPYDQTSHASTASATWESYPGKVGGRPRPQPPVMEAPPGSSRPGKPGPMAPEAPSMPRPARVKPGPQRAPVPDNWMAASGGRAHHGVATESGSRPDSVRVRPRGHPARPPGVIRGPGPGRGEWTSREWTGSYPEAEASEDHRDSQATVGVVRDANVLRGSPEWDPTLSGVVRDAGGACAQDPVWRECEASPESHGRPALDEATDCLEIGVRRGGEHGGKVC